MSAIDAAANDKQNVSTLLEDLSVEITGKDIEALTDAKSQLPQGTRVHVTHLGTEDLGMRVGAAATARELGFVPVPHISARRFVSKDALEECLSALQLAGASENIFVVGGDPSDPEGPYEDSLEVIRSDLRRYGVEHVSVSGYPEGHPDIGEDRLWWAIQEKHKVLREQQLPGAVVTQFSFDVDPVLSWIAAVRERGIDLPIRVGVPGPAGVKRLLAYAKRFGAGTSTTIARKYGLSLTNLLSTAGPDRLIEHLAAGYDHGTHGAVKLHFYTFGGLKQTADWVAEFAYGAVSQ